MVIVWLGLIRRARVVGKAIDGRLTLIERQNLEQFLWEIHLQAMVAVFLAVSTICIGMGIGIG